MAGAAILVLNIFGAIFGVLAVRSYGYAERDRDLLVRHGRMVRRLSIVPYARMQFVDVTAGPLERLFNIATVRLHTAAAASDATIPGLEAARGDPAARPPRRARRRPRRGPVTQEQGQPLITRQRLHPLSPVLKGLRLFVLAVVAMSWRSLQQLHFWNWLAMVAGLFVILLVYSTIAWRFTGYEVVGRELRIYEGLISRRVRTVPLERLQAIEVVQPFQAKPFGLAELKLDVAGAQKSEAPLAFLPMPQALALRGQLLAFSGGATARPSSRRRTSRSCTASTTTTWCSARSSPRR